MPSSPHLGPLVSSSQHSYNAHFTVVRSLCWQGNRFGTAPKRFQALAGTFLNEWKDETNVSFRVTSLLCIKQHWFTALFCFPCLRGEGRSSGQLHNHATFQQPLQPDFPFSSKKKRCLTGTTPKPCLTSIVSLVTHLQAYASAPLFFCPEGLMSPWIQDQSLTVSFSQGHSAQRHCEDWILTAAHGDP